MQDGSRLGLLAQRQAELERRARALAAVADPSQLGGARMRATGQSQDLSSQSPAEGRRPLDKTATIRAGLSQLEAWIDHLERTQTATLTEMEQDYDRSVERLRGLLNGVGLETALGGPFVPADPRPSPPSFDAKLTRLKGVGDEIALLRRAVASLPLGRPVPGMVELSSKFGVRLDRFLHSPAIHTGVDFRGPEGTPVVATAAGKVTHAGWSGSYGNLVEIDHGHGVTTRYGHLRAIEVMLGDEVEVGQPLGTLGATGRASGPHLHYETRRGGEPVDPERF